MTKQKMHEYQQTAKVFREDSDYEGNVEYLLNKLHRYEVTLHRLSGNACNGWPKKRHELRNGQRFVYDEEDPNWRIRDEKKEARTKEKVKEIAKELGFRVSFNGDPRGACISFTLPSKRYNSWDGETWRIYW